MAGSCKNGGGGNNSSDKCNHRGCRDSDEGDIIYDTFSFLVGSGGKEGDILLILSDHWALLDGGHETHNLYIVISLKRK